MGEIHILPTPSLDTAHTTRLCADLEKAFAAGLDLGSRVAHIQAAGAMVKRLTGQLEETVEGLLQDLSAAGLEAQRAELEVTLRAFMTRAETLATCATRDGKGEPQAP